jgi:hypothetical protein
MANSQAKQFARAIDRKAEHVLLSKPPEVSRFEKWKSSSFKLRDLDLLSYVNEACPFFHSVQFFAHG